MRKVMYVISAILLVTSGYMYWIMDKNQLHLQAPTVSILSGAEDQNSKHAEDNPYVIRNGSNAMPKGMGQTDKDQQNQTFMPQWQKDKIKDLRGDPYQGSAGSSQQTTPPSTTPPSATPPSTTPNVNQGQGVTPSTFSKGDIGTLANGF